jgi:alpha-tubulin suppressor-like RCC1 family protein
MVRNALTLLGLVYLVLLQTPTVTAQNVTQISAGQYHSLFLRADGSLWGTGGNQFGQLGIGNFIQTNAPVEIISNGVTQIAVGGFHSLFIKSDGSLWGMGLDYFGELGCGPGVVNGMQFGTNRPEQIVTSNTVAIAAGAAHSLILKNDGSLWAMGYDAYGQLGDGTTNDNSYYPEQIVASNVIAVAAGAFHSLFLKHDGSLWGMGYNLQGELGDGTTNVISIPEQIVGSNITAIAAGYAHSLFLKADGSLWGMGNNALGQLGDGTTNDADFPEQIVSSNVVAVAAGVAYSFFIKNDGSLWAMGQMGDWPTNVLYFSTNRPQQIFDQGLKEIAGGYYHSLFLMTDGSVWASGDNEQGQLGDRAYSASVRAVQMVASASYNQISAKCLNSGDMQLTFVGNVDTTYVLDRSFSLTSPNWIPQATNLANSFGDLIFTNTPGTATNSFWRVRSLPK